MTSHRLDLSENHSMSSLTLNFINKDLRALLFYRIEICIFETHLPEKIM